MAEGLLPPVIAILTADAAQFKATMLEAKASMAETAGAGESSMSGLAKFGGAALAGITTAAAGISVVAVKMAGDFQESMTKLVVGAGESEGAIKGLSSQVLKLAGPTAQAPKDLAAALYPIESVGFHGGQGLFVLTAAAEAATASGANLGSVADALAGTMHAFNLQSSAAIPTVNTLQAAVASGKMKLDDLAGALGTVGPIAATAHVSLQEITAAIATMTSSGTPAAQAATYLKQTIAQLENPTSKARDQMKALGLDSIAVSENLGKNGLASTLTMLTDAIEKKVGPAGTLLIKSLKQGTLTTEQYQAKLAAMPATEQTYVSALANMVGGTKSMQAALELTGPHMAEFQKNIGYVSAQAKNGGGQVAGFALAMKDFNTKIRAGEDTVKALLIQLGLRLIPIVEAAVSVIAKIVSWFTKHKEITEALGIVIGGILVVAIGAYLVAVGLAVAATVLWWLTFNAATLGIGIAVTAIVAGILYVVGHWKQVWGEVTKIFGDTVSWIKQHALLLLAIFAPFLIPFYELLTHWKQIWHEITDVFDAFTAGLFNLDYKVNGPLTSVEKVFIHLGEIIRGVFVWIAQAWDDATGWIAALPGKLGGYVAEAYDAVTGWFVRLPGEVGRWVAETIDTVLQFLSTLPMRMAYWAGYAIGAYIRFWWSLPGWIWDILKLIWKYLSQWGADAIGWGVATAKGVYDNVTGWFEKMPGRIIGFLNDVYTQLAAWAVSAWQWADKTGKDVYDAVTDWFQKLPGRIVTLLVDSYNQMVQWGSTALNWAVQAGKDVYNGVTGWFEKLPGRAVSILDDLYNTISGAGVRLGGAAVDLGAKILNGIWSFITSIPSKAGELAEAIWHLITGAASKALDAAAHLGSAIWSGFKKGLGLSSPSHLERAMDTIIGNLQDKMGPLRDIMGGVNGLVPGNIGGPTISPILGATSAALGGADAGSTTVVLQVNDQVLGQVILNNQLLRNRRNQSSTVAVGLG